MSAHNKKGEVDNIARTDKRILESCAIRHDRSRIFKDNSIRLYNVDEDLAETKYLSKKYPEKAASLLAELKKWQPDTKALIPTKLNAKFSP